MLARFPSVITKNHRQEDLSRAYALAIGAAAGVLVSLGASHDYGVDGDFRAVARRGSRIVATGIGVDFQLKASIRWKKEAETIVYDLEADAYNDLVERTYGIPLILILLCLPKTEAEWLVCSESRLLLRRACYWFEPAGVATGNSSTTRIRIPRTNLFDVAALTNRMEAARQRELTR